MGDVSIISGVVPVLVLVVGAAGLLLLLARRGRRAVVTAVAAVTVALVTFLGVNWLVTTGLNLFPEDLPPSVTAWLAVGSGAVVLAVGNLVGTSAGRKVAALVSGVAVLLAAGSQINIYFAQYPTLAALAGDGDTGVSTLTGAAKRPSQSESTPVVDRWNGPAATGASQVVTTAIPGTVSGFTARDAYIYLPAIYSAPSAPLLPVSLSLPTPPISVSMPLPPLSVSSPPFPVSVFLASLPIMESLPTPPIAFSISERLSLS